MCERVSHFRDGGCDAFDTFQVLVHCRQRRLYVNNRRAGLNHNIRRVAGLPNRIGFASGVSFGAAIGIGGLVAWLLGQEKMNGRKALGSRVLFHPSAEIGFQVTPAHRVSAYFEHVSNAYLARPNPGMDNIGVRLSPRF